MQIMVNSKHIKGTRIFHCGSCLLRCIRVQIARCESRRGKDLNTNQQDTSYFDSMAFDPKLIPLFNRSDSRQSVVEWLEKAELIYQLCGVKFIKSVILIRLSGHAYTVYQQLNEEKCTDFSCVQKRLYTAFAQDPFTAWKQFAVHRSRPREMIDVFLAELHRLAVLFEGMSVEGLQCVFVGRLPEHAEQLI